MNGSQLVSNAHGLYPRACPSFTASYQFNDQISIESTRSYFICGVRYWEQGIMIVGACLCDQNKCRHVLVSVEPKMPKASTLHWHTAYAITQQFARNMRSLESNRIHQSLGCIADFCMAHACPQWLRCRLRIYID
jgi:hypothetical protein